MTQNLVFMKYKIQKLNVWNSDNNYSDMTFYRLKIINRVKHIHITEKLCFQTGL